MADVVEDDSIFERDARNTAGNGFDLSGKSSFDHASMWKSHSESERLQLSKDELTWLERYRKPGESVEVTLNLSCGIQQIPYLMQLTVALFERLGVDFVATAGPQFCCGRYFQRYELPQGDQLSATSIKRLASWNAPTNVQVCGSCYVEFGYQVGRIRKQTGSVPFEVTHYTEFLRDRLIKMGDDVPWVRRVPRRVLLHAEGGQPGTYETKVLQRGWVIETLGLVPGIEFVGMVQDPSLGNPCSSKKPGDPSILHDISPEQYRQVQAELEEQARTVGADAIVVHHHMCHREWTKFSSPRLPIMHYQALLAEALGIDLVDRYSMLWQLGDPARILEASRPYWESWGIAEDHARELVKKFFVPKYAAAIPQCACAGSCAVAGLRRDADVCAVAE